MPHANVSTVTSSDSEKNEGSGSKFYFSRGYFTRDHYDQLLSMVDPPTGTCKDNALAGKHALSGNVNVDFRWIIDSGATQHITYCNSLLGECRKLLDSNHNKVQVTIGNRIHVDHVGDAVILGDYKAPTQDLYLNATCKHQTYALLLNLLHMSQHQVQTLL
ncbi:hypothetical protein H5410_027948 [Solanum commersonii]|uniref:Uncharacterized protein n=1 Tax=Solanum commersonii TaxID=4109 RepID=A0A9J5Z3D6_SOLCO|nr:hypothetical protein H5410_027948 [Solanum commersonii]